MLMRLLELYRHTDVSMARALEERIGLAAIARAGGIDTMPKNVQPAAAVQVRAYFAESAGRAAKFMARPDGPRVGALAFDGWDTHANEGAVNGRLAALLGALDGAIAAIEIGMGPAWRDAVVAVVTEFGRTARINGSDGTDHGTGWGLFYSPRGLTERRRARLALRPSSTSRALAQCGDELLLWSASLSARFEARFPPFTADSTNHPDRTT